MERRVRTTRRRESGTKRRTVPEPIVGRGIGDVEVRKLNLLVSKEEVVGDHNSSEGTEERKRDRKSQFECFA